jgi:hypothetical protein
VKKITLNKSTIEQLAPNLLLVVLNDNAEINVEDVIEIKEANGNIIGEIDYGVIMDSGKFTSISSEARNLTATKEMEGKRIAMAIVINNLSQRLIVNFFLKINKPLVPTKSFSDISGARKWIETIINQ